MTARRVHAPWCWSAPAMPPPADKGGGPRNASVQIVADRRPPLAEPVNVPAVRAVVPLRIAHVVNEPFGPESANGVQQVVYCLARAQAEGNHSVAVFSREEGTRIVGAGSDAPRPATAAVHGPSEGSLRGRILARYSEPDLVGTVLAWQPDIVHFHSVHIPQNVAFAADLSRARVPYCVTVHGALFRAALQRGRLKKAAFNVLFERRYLNAAEFIHAVSPREAEAIRRHGVIRPIVVVPNGIPPDAGIPAARPEMLYEENPRLRGRRIFMFIGRLDAWQKGLDLLVRAFALAGLHHAALVLVGPDYRGSRRRLTALAARLGVRSEIMFAGPAFGERRANLLAAADVFAHPSRWEGLSLSVLAAAAAGKPCLVTEEADPLGELERAQAAVVVEPTVASIAAGLTRAAGASDAELAAIGICARHVAETHFNWPTIADRLVEAYSGSVCPAGAGILEGR